MLPRPSRPEEQLRTPRLCGATRKRVNLRPLDSRIPFRSIHNPQSDVLDTPVCEDGGRALAEPQGDYLSPQFCAEGLLFRHERDPYFWKSRPACFP